jgi:hypothetical protein
MNNDMKFKSSHFEYTVYNPVLEVGIQNLWNCLAEKKGVGGGMYGENLD